MHSQAKRKEPWFSFGVVDRSTKILLLIVVASIAMPFALVALLSASGWSVSDLIVQALILAVMFPLIASSLYMWATGKGAMLIAGYNTSPKAVRDRYDSVSLSKFVGKLMTISMIVMLAGLEMLVLDLSTTMFWVLLFASTAILFGGIFYMNTGKRFLRVGAQEIVVAEKDRRRNRLIAVASLASVAVILAAVFLFIGSGSVSASLEHDALQVNAPFVDEHIAYGDIRSVELRQTFDDGRRVGGFGGSEVSSGNFLNDELGRYTLARYNAVESCIVVHHTGGVLVFNLDSSDTTERMYGDLLSKL